MQKTILVTGANGQLGNEIKQLSTLFTGYDFLFTTRQELSIEENDSVAQFFETHKIDCCINCAAYTAVDKAETETALAFRVNGDAVGNLATICKNYNALFIHISTDYVFDGSATSPYKEDHPVSPVNLYGASKLKGEQLAMANNPDAIIIRTSWVYAAYGNNFVKTMLRLMKERESINVVSDQQGCPTFAADLAIVVMKMVTYLKCSPMAVNSLGLKSNIFHYSNAGITNWFEFAVAIKELSGSNCQVNPILTSAYPTPAKRPAYSVMDTEKIQETFQLTIPFWKDSLQKCITTLTK
ncbi:MAG: dTDP-4-dehydrorhamnose reductase [Ferruginibacter sp.]